MSIRNMSPLRQMNDYSRLNGKVERSHQTDEEKFYRLRRYSTQKD